VHFLMLLATGLLFALGVALFLWDFFLGRGRPLPVPATEPRLAETAT
jgi:hypothetical protein